MIHTWENDIKTFCKDFNGKDYILLLYQLLSNKWISLCSTLPSNSILNNFCKPSEQSDDKHKFRTIFIFLFCSVFSFGECMQRNFGFFMTFFRFIQRNSQTFYLVSMPKRFLLCHSVLTTTAHTVLSYLNNQIFTIICSKVHNRKWHTFFSLEKTFLSCT